MKVQFGTGRRCINPQVPVSLAGYFNKRMWTGVLDDIEVRALVIQGGETRVAMINFDLVTVSAGLYESILRDINGLGFSRENLLVTATHTHTAPEVRAGKPGSNPEYLPFASRMAAEALQAALAGMREGELFCGETTDHRFLFNRRYWLNDGRVVTNPGKLNREILRPEGEIDPEIPILAIRAEEKFAVVIANIVNHTDTIGGTNVSADWAGFFTKTVQSQMGQGSMAIPLIGCAGNINHFDVRTDMNQTCYTEAERIGKGYAHTVLNALDGLKKVEGDSIKTVFGVAESFSREIDPAELAEAKAVCAKYPDIDVEKLEKSADITSEDLANGTPLALKYFANTLVKMAEKTLPMSFNLTGFQFGENAVIASLPCEPFTEIGLELRKSIFKDKTCLAASHGNGTGNVDCGGGYIPNPWNYGRGGYETTPRSNPFSVKTGEILLAKWRELAQKLK